MTFILSEGKIFRQKKYARTGISVRLNHRHYGYYSDLISGVINTALLVNFRNQEDKNVYNSPIVSRFIKDDESVPPVVTKCSNIDYNNRIFGPYFDDIVPENAIDREEYINEIDTLTTI
jgi:hypothetical protein